MDALEQILEGSQQAGLVELRETLRALLDAPNAAVRFLDQQQLQSRHPRVFRLRFARNGEVRSLIVKRLEPAIAWRNQLVTGRWLPAVDLGDSGPILLAAAAERSGQCVWHVYQDHGDWALDANDPDPARVRPAVELVAKIHTRFAGHPLLAECRLYGGDLGIHYFACNVRDAANCLESLRAPAADLSGDRRALRDRLLERLQRLLDGHAERAQAMGELGAPETLLHGDLWTTNTFVLPGANGPQARLIDWDHAAVGPISYDLSTFLLRFPRERRPWILDLYRQSVARAGWRLPPAEDLNLLFETAELARFANRVIWPALAIANDGAEWGFDELSEVERWFEDLEPVLPEASQIHHAKPVAR